MPALSGIGESGREPRESLILDVSRVSSARARELVTPFAALAQSARAASDDKAARMQAVRRELDDLAASVAIALVCDDAAIAVGE